MLWTRAVSPPPAPALTPEDRAVAAYVGLAIGDALGATVEFLTPREIQHQHGVHQDISGGGWLRLKPGQVTDDTTMSLALGEAILAAGRVDARAAADAFDAWMRGKPVDIGNTVRRNLITYRKTGNPEAPPSEHDAGNGAAMQLYQRACDGGSLFGCASLGRMYEHGLGVAQDHTRAVQLYQRACEGNNLLGCARLGAMYERGLGVAQNFAQALQLLQRACDGNDPIGCLHLGAMYSHGQGVTRDNARAMPVCTPIQAPSTVGTIDSASSQ